MAKQSTKHRVKPIRSKIHTASDSIKVSVKARLSSGKHNTYWVWYITNGEIRLGIGIVKELTAWVGYNERRLYWFRDNQLYISEGMTVPGDLARTEEQLISSTIKHLFCNE